MNSINNLTLYLHNIFIKILLILDKNIDNIHYDNIINIILLFSINNIIFIHKILKNINSNYLIHKSKKAQLLKKINYIESKLSIQNNEILSKYNSLKKNKKENINIVALKRVNYNINTIHHNLDIYNIEDIEFIELTNLNNIDPLNTYKNSNYKGYKQINIGFNNFYYLHTYKFLNENIPTNLLLYIEELQQVVIKVGYNNKYNYINSKLYNLSKESNDKNNLILCNNNIKLLNKKCNNKNCTFYHDYILGYKDNYHKNRNISYNPIVYKCPSFKDGSKVKKNIKTIPWHDAINLYQSSLSNLLIGCLHSQEKII